MVLLFFQRKAVNLLSGLGIGTSPSALIAHSIKTTIVEIDPIVHQYASQYFGLPKNHTSIIKDAVAFVDDMERTSQCRGKYDYIIHDVFTGGAEPIDLFTKEFLEGLSFLLHANGVIAIVSCMHAAYSSIKTNENRITAVIYCLSLPQSSYVRSCRSSPNVVCSGKSLLLWVSF